MIKAAENDGQERRRWYFDVDVVRSWMKHLGMTKADLLADMTDRKRKTGKAGPAACTIDRALRTGRVSRGVYTLILGALEDRARRLFHG